MTDSTAPAPIMLGEGSRVARIVAPVTLAQRHDRGVSASAALAERFGLPVLLVNVDLGADDAVHLERGTEISAALDAMRAAHPSVDVDDIVIAAATDPAGALADRLEPGDLVVLATEAMEGAPGSFAQDLSIRSNVPVLMIGPNAELGSLTGDVMVAVDGSTLAERIIPLALGFASALGVNLKLVEAVSSVVTDHVRRLKERGERVSENAYIRDLAERLDDDRVIWEVIHADDPGLAVTEAAAQSGASMIAMSTHGRGGFVAQVFGSVTFDTVRHASCPVLVQRPVSDAVVKELVSP